MSAPRREFLGYASIAGALASLPTSAFAGDKADPSLAASPPPGFVPFAAPGRIVKVIDSPLPNERHLALRDTPAFMELAHEVREALADGHHG